MSANDNSEFTLIAWCLIIGSGMACIPLETWLPPVVMVVAILVGLYTVKHFGR